MITKDQLIKALQDSDVPGGTPIAAYDKFFTEAYLDISQPRVVDNAPYIEGDDGYRPDEPLPIVNCTVISVF